MVYRKSYLDFKVTPVFWWNMNSTKRYKANQGGMWSSKTRSILQVLAGHRAQQQEPKDILVLGQDVPNLKLGPIKEFTEILKSSNIISNNVIGYNKSDRIATFKNGSTIKFNSVSDVQDARQGKRHITFINEANGIDYLIAKEVMDRTSEEIFFDYNPDFEFWVHSKIVNDKPSSEVDFFISNCFEHNPFTPNEIIKSLINDSVKDKNRYKVMGLGLSGKVDGLVFPNIQIIEKLPEHIDKHGYGLDFGYSNDPTSLVRCGLDRGVIVGDQLIYEKGLSNREIAARFAINNIHEDDEIWADSADPKSIAELCTYGYNVKPAKKGPDSIKFGINLINQYGPPKLTQQSKQWIKEQQKYGWVKKGTEYTNTPIDKWNHAWDACRYWAIMSLMETEQEEPMLGNYDAFMY